MSHSRNANGFVQASVLISMYCYSDVDTVYSTACMNIIMLHLLEIIICHECEVIIIVIKWLLDSY